MTTSRFTIIAASAVALIILALLASGLTYPVQPITPAGLAEADGFWSLEFNNERSYRWTNGHARFHLPGFETASSLYVTLTLTAPQYPGARPVAARLQVDDSAPFHFTVAPEWRRYHILAAVTAPRWRTPVVQLTTATWTPGVHDRRQLGIAVSEGAVQRLGSPRLLAAVERGLFLAALVALFSVIVRRPQPYGGMLAAIAVVALGMLGAWTPARLVQMLPTNWSLAGEMLAAAAAVEAVRLRRRMPPYLLPVVAVTVAGTGTLLVAAPGWVIAGAVFLICGAWLSALAPGRSSGVRPAAPSSIPSPNPWQHVALGSIVTIALVSILVPGIADTESRYHVDESYWVSVSVQAFRTAFIERDLDHPFWFDYASLHILRHPQISKYIIGAGAYLAGYHDVPMLLYNFRQDLAWNKAHGRVLPPEIIGAARFSVALTGALCGAFLYWLGVQVAGPVTGILAVVLFIATPVVWDYARFAMLDIPALMFGLLALNLGIRAVTALRTGSANAGAWIAACGAACGAAVGAKLNALLIPGICVLAIGLTSVAHQHQSDRYTLISGVVSLLLWTWVVFFLSNPGLYSHPVAGIQHMLDMSRIVASGEFAPLPTLASRISAVWTSLGDGGYIGSGGLPGSRLWLIIGAISLTRALLQRQPGAHLSALSVIALWGGVSFVGITLWISQNADRYYLPLAPIVALLQAYGIIEIINVYRGSLLSIYSKIGFSLGIVLLSVAMNYYDTTHHFYPASHLPSQIWQVSGLSREITDDTKESGFLSYGPYVTLPPGGYIAIFEYKSDARSDTSIGFVDVATDKGRTVITQQEVYGTNGSPSYIEISFSIQERQEIEVRFWYNGNGTGSTSLRSLTIRPR
ncbi:phospholipid carrier-dependent glycosyltransferase [Roseiflexus sp. RS-1]|uniref:phospholipid carrier-dependent glycosyltransferase n=1 Tax=Roseiflexus sp. (strain RS-1) TaxID=357808 RepID=UPI001E55608A|nr:phospholipid carrier-dependent glycosyltransferase [Roseiflexus sp. RS-1]